MRTASATDAASRATGPYSLMPCKAGPVAFELIRWAGLAFVALDISMILYRGSLRVEAGDSSPVPGVSLVRKAILLHLLNPKLTLVFLSARTFLRRLCVTACRAGRGRRVGVRVAWTSSLVRFAAQLAVTDR